MNEVVAIFCSDIHLSHVAPVARSAEPDWYVAQARPLDQVRAMAQLHKCPVVCAGDVFDRWNSNPELINWAIVNLPRMYAIPGQHDLPLHNLDDIKRSAYWTLVEAGVIDDLAGRYIDPNYGFNGWIIPKELHVLGFPWGKELYELEGREDYPDDHEVQLAVAHRYVWTRGNQYPGAPKESHLNGLKGALVGYDVAVFGDNHHGFLASAGGCKVLNCGCLIRRKQDERHLRPAVGLLYGDGTVERHELDVSEDLWLDVEQEADAAAADPGLEQFLEELGRLDVSDLDFRAAVNRYIEENRVEGAVKDILLEAIEGSR